jgi:hypothetical protein
VCRVGAAKSFVTWNNNPALSTRLPLHKPLTARNYANHQQSVSGFGV